VCDLVWITERRSDMLSFSSVRILTYYYWSSRMVEDRDY